GAERSHRLSICIALRVMDLRESRLHDVVAIPEVNVVVLESAAVSSTEQCEGLPAGQGALLDLVELRDLVGVDRGDEMDPRGCIEGSRPGFRRAWSDIPELQRAGIHAFDEFVRECLE